MAARQVCGARGGDAARLHMSLTLSKNSEWLLAFKSPWHRNFCIYLIRQARTRLERRRCSAAAV